MMKRKFIYEMLKELAKLDWMIPEYMLPVTLAFMDSVKGGDNEFTFDYVDFMRELKEYDLFGMNADSMIDIILTLEDI